MSAPTLAEVLSPILADMRIKAANLRQGAPRIAEFADVADWIEGWELAIATAVQEMTESKYTARYTLQDNTLEQAERSALCDRQRIIARAEEKGTDA